MLKNPPASAEDTRDAGSIPGSGRSPGGGNGNPLQYSCRENSMDRGAWQATVRGVPKSQTRTETCLKAALSKWTDWTTAKMRAPTLIWGSPGGEDPLEKGITTHYSILARRKP